MARIKLKVESVMMAAADGTGCWQGGASPPPPPSPPAVPRLLMAQFPEPTLEGGLSRLAPVFMRWLYVRTAILTDIYFTT